MLNIKFLLLMYSIMFLYVWFVTLLYCYVAYAVYDML